MDTFTKTVRFVVWDDTTGEINTFGPIRLTETEACNASRLNERVCKELDETDDSDKSPLWKLESHRFFYRKSPIPPSLSNWYCCHMIVTASPRGLSPDNDGEIIHSSVTLYADN